MKVVHFCREFSPLSQTFIYDLVISLQECGVSNTVLTDARSNIRDRPFNHVIVPPDIKPGMVKKTAFRFLNIIAPHRFDRNRLSLNSKKKFFRQTIAQENPSIIHAHFGDAAVDLMLLSDGLKIPFIASFHGFDAFKLSKDRKWQSYFKSLFQRADAVTVVSQLMKAHLINLGCPEHKLHVIHVGKILSDYCYNDTSIDKVRKFVSIGRLTEKKGHIDCILAFKKLLPNYPDLQLEIIGEGELAGEIINTIDQHALSSNIKMLGPVSHQQAKAYLSAADAFILCSKTAKDGDREGIPTVLMEAQALGIPCVTTRHSGIPEVIPKQNHWLLAEEGNVESIAHCTEKLINASPTELSNAKKSGRKMIEEAFNLELETKKLVGLYSALK